MKEITLADRQELIEIAMCAESEHYTDIVKGPRIWLRPAVVVAAIRMEVSLDGDKGVNMELVLAATISVLARMPVVSDKTWLETGVCREMDFLEGAYVDNDGDRSNFLSHVLMYGVNRTTEKPLDYIQIKYLSGLIRDTKYFKLMVMTDLIESMHNVTIRDFDKTAAKWLEE